MKASGQRCECVNPHHAGGLHTTSPPFTTSQGSTTNRHESGPTAPRQAINGCPEHLRGIAALGFRNLHDTIRSLIHGRRPKDRQAETT